MSHRITHTDHRGSNNNMMSLVPQNLKSSTQIVETGTTHQNVPIEVLKLREIIRKVFSVISHTNPYVRSCFPAEEIKNLIEDHAEICLERFGLELCETIARPIMRWEENPFNEKSNYTSFLDLCKKEKCRREAAKHVAENEAAIKLQTEAHLKWLHEAAAKQRELIK